MPLHHYVSAPSYLAEAVFNVGFLRAWLWMPILTIEKYDFQDEFSTFMMGGEL